jgi:hypothetical protein
MLRATTVGVIAASLAVLFINEASARGRSFPIEITGTVLSVNRMNHTFTIRADEPARILTIAMGRDCKFKQNGASTGEQILRPGVRVKVSYFATIFTGDIAVAIESNPVPEVRIGTIEKIEAFDRKLEIRLHEDSCHLVLYWAANARVLKAGKRASAADLKERAVVRVSYYSPAFGRKYAIKIELQSAL